MDVGELTFDAPGATELGAVLSELSRQRARQGFSATETGTASCTCGRCGATATSGWS